MLQLAGDQQRQRASIPRQRREHGRRGRDRRRQVLSDQREARKIQLHADIARQFLGQRLQAGDRLRGLSALRQDHHSEELDLIGLRSARQVVEEAARAIPAPFAHQGAGEGFAKRQFELR